MLNKNLILNQILYFETILIVTSQEKRCILHLKMSLSSVEKHLLSNSFFFILLQIFTQFTHTFFIIKRPFIPFVSYILLYNFCLQNLKEDVIICH